MTSATARNHFATLGDYPIIVDAASYALLFLSDGRVFISRDGGAAVEADAFERSYVTFLLTLQEHGVLDPTRGLELLPPAES